MKNKLVVIQTVCLLIACMSIQGSASAKNDLENDYYIETMNKQETAVEANNAIYDSFSMSEDDEWIVPDEFSGTYIDENGKLIVCLKEPNLLNVAHYYEIVRDYAEVVQIKPVKYSYNELCEIKKEVMNGLQVEGVDFHAVGISISKNAIVIRTTEDGFSKVNEYAEASEYPLLVELDNAPKTMADLRGGDMLNNISSGALYSLSVCGYYDNYNSVLICGHRNNGINDQIKKGGASTAFGKVVFKRFPALGGLSSGDYAIVRVTGSATTTGTVWTYGDNNSIANVNGTNTLLAENTVVYRYGYVTGYGYGQVDLVNTTIIYPGESVGNDGYQVNNMISVDNVVNHPQPGDSGGPFFTKSSNKLYFCGVFSGGSASYLYFTPYSVIRNATGFTVKTAGN